MVALEQILRSAELRICSEALAPKKGLEQIRAKICSNWSKYLFPVANDLVHVNPFYQSFENEGTLLPNFRNCNKTPEF